jgi:hypothetical protein
LGGGFIGSSAGSSTGDHLSSNIGGALTSGPQYSVGTTAVGAGLMGMSNFGGGAGGQTNFRYGIFSQGS